MDELDERTRGLARAVLSAIADYLEEADARGDAELAALAVRKLPNAPELLAAIRNETAASEAQYATRIQSLHAEAVRVASEATTDTGRKYAAETARALLNEMHERALDAAMYGKERGRA